MDQKPKLYSNSKNYKTPRRKYGKLHDIGLENDLLAMTPKARQQK